MSENFSSWIEIHRIDVVWQTNNIFTVRGRNENFLLLEDKSKMLDEEGNLILSSVELRLLSSIQYMVFIFGTKYYYCKSNAEFTLIPFKNIGTAKDSIDVPHIGIHGHYELCNTVGGTYESICDKAQFLGITTLGICEKHTLAGAIAFQNSCEKANIKSIIGATLTIRDKESAYLLKIYCKNEEGFSNLIYLNNVLKLSEQEEISEEVLFSNSSSLLFIYDKNNDFNKYRISRLKNKLNIYYQLDLTEFDSNSKDKTLLDNYTLYFQSFLIPPIYVCDTYMLEPYQAKIRKKINEIGKGGAQTYSKQAYFKSVLENNREWSKLFSNLGNEYVESLFQSSIQVLKEFCDSVDWKIKSQLRLPKYKFSPEESQNFNHSEEFLWYLIAVGFEEKIQGQVENEQVYVDRIHEELSVIKEGGFIDYFLIIRDFLNWSREHDILTGLGRGSAAGCLISYLLDIVQVDPIKYNLLFERFLNRGRLKKGLPDIDCDILSYRRDEVKHYIEQKYGINYVASIGTYTTFQFKAALKDLSRVYNIPFQTANYISAALSEVDSFADLIRVACKSPTVKSFLINNSELIEAIVDIQYQAKTPSIHAAGIVIVPEVENMDILRWIPVKRVDGVIVTEWEGEYLDQLGFLKCDILGIRQLDKFYDIEALIFKHTQKKVTFQTIDLEDTKTFKLFQDGSNEDVFQFGAQGLKSYTRQLKPNSIEDLIATVALYRPGPIGTGAHKQYINLKNGRETPEYHFGIEHLTNKTYSLFIYQEQVIQTVQELGGLTLVEGDEVRKGMGKKDQSLLDKYKEIFLKGAIDKGCSKEEADVIWNKMEVFGAYAFNRCISGDEKIYRASQNKQGKSTFWPTIEEMYNIMNSSSYACERGKLPLRWKYKKHGYPHSFSLNENNRLIKNKIKDIRFIGKKDIYRVTTETGRTIDVTLNHKFPTNNGEKKLEDIDIDNDKLYVNVGFIQYDFSHRFGKEENHNYPIKGQQGFVGKDTNYTQWKSLKQISVDACQICDIETGRIEIHHKDGNHSNNVKENVEYLCASCHKKNEYKLGRTKMGEARLHTNLESIVYIDFLKTDNVYDVEMEHPYHTFTMQSGIVTSNSHAACYALTGYYSQWLKANFPIYFWAISLQYSKEDNLSNRLSEITRTSTIKLSPVDINKSENTYQADFKNNIIYWSFSSLKFVGEGPIEVIISDRLLNGPFYSLEDFIDRMNGKKINKRHMVSLILSGAFDQVEKITHIEQRQSLFRRLEIALKKVSLEDISIYMSHSNPIQWYFWQKEYSGYAVFNYRTHWAKRKKYSANIIEEVPDESFIGTEVTVIGIPSLIEIRESKKGKFLRLKLACNFETFDIVLWNDIYLKYSSIFEDQSIYSKVVSLNVKVIYDSYRQSISFHSQKNTIISYDF